MLGNIKKLIAGNGLAQAIQFASLLVLSRIYYPSDFGLLAKIQSMSTIAVIVATLQLHLSIPLSKSKNEAQSTVQAIQMICVLFCLGLLPIAFFLGKVFLFSVFLTLFLGLANTYNSYLIYSGSFGKLSKFYVARAVSIVAFQLSLSVFSINDGLLWGTLVGEGLAALYLRIVVLFYLPIKPFELKTTISLIAKWRSFSFYGTTQELVSVLAFYSPLLLFVNKFGESIGGQYAMASRLVWAPVILLVSSISQVLYHSFGQSNPVDRLKLLESCISKKLVIFSLVLCLISFFLENLFLKILGQQWELTSKLLPITLTWGCIFILSTPFRVMCRAIQLQKYQMVIDAFMLTAIISLFLFFNFTPINTMWGLVITALVQNLAIVIAVWYILKNPENILK